MGLLVLALMALAICNMPVLGGAKVASIQDQQDYLTAHNQARAAVGVGPLKWSTGLLNVVTRLVKSSTKNCTVANGPEANNYGVNQFRLLAEHNWLPRGVVSRWVEMKKYYNYAKNECVPQGQPCRTYTQVVWRNTLELGCAQAMCDKGAGYLTICLYNPSGNIEGQSPY